MASVIVSDIVKTYGAVKVLHGVNLAIGDGEFVVLVGPSGCGKSTLLRMIAGLEAITQGDVQIGQAVVTNLAPKERNIAMVFQNYALYPHMRVRDNMAFSLKLARRSRADINKAVARAADILDLSQLLDRYPRELSGGQRQRVAMGRAIVRDPAVFLFDEPLSNLDAKLRVQMRAEIKELHQRLRTTIIYVTHDQIEAMTMADRVVVMREGNVEQVGAPLNLYDNPSNTFVASFIGSPTMNLITGQVESNQGVPVFIADGGTSWPLPWEARVNLGDRIVMGIRPEHIAIAKEGLAATIVLAEPTGGETQLTLAVGNERVTTVTRDRISPPVGAVLNILPDLARIHLFEENSGKRIYA